MSIKANISSVFLAIALVGGLWFERSLVRKAEAENRALNAQTEATEAATTSEPVSEASAAAAKRELAGLRNEVRQLRAERRDLAVMRLETERLRQEVAGKSQPRPAPSEELGFVMNDRWADAGLGSPEATIQTFFWAARQQNYDAMLTCMSSNLIKATRLIDRKTQTIRPEVLDELAVIARVPAYRVAEIQSASEDRVRAMLQCAVEGATIRVTLSREGADWRISDF